MIAREGSVPCPVGDSRPALVHGGWQEARGASIGPQYTQHNLNNSYFVENIREELDFAGEWFLDWLALFYGACANAVRGKVF